MCVNEPPIFTREQLILLTRQLSVYQSLQQTGLSEDSIFHIMPYMQQHITTNIDIDDTSCSQQSTMKRTFDLTNDSPAHGLDHKQRRFMVKWPSAATVILERFFQMDKNPTENQREEIARVCNDELQKAALSITSLNWLSLLPLVLFHFCLLINAHLLGLGIGVSLGLGPPLPIPPPSTFPGTLLGLGIGISLGLGPPLPIPPPSTFHGTLLGIGVSLGLGPPLLALLPSTFSGALLQLTTCFRPPSLTTLAHCPTPCPILLSSCSAAAVSLLFSCSAAAVSLLFSCSTAAVSILFSCSAAAVFLLFSCSTAAVSILFSCFAADVSILFSCSTAAVSTRCNALIENMARRA
uniref:Homeobox domain-containing protein n=1 Tax=Branchiostoma floridae TaxID=7739 RepID=C3YVQ3_BRAFL|eukprot:XP_002599575.1 hypothetical protein BRAFLDRAFT_77675 [Branchiostoma floridae]